MSALRLEFDDPTPATSLAPWRESFPVQPPRLEKILKSR